MPTYLLTVQPEDFHEGILSPEFRLSRFRAEPVLKSLAPGRQMQLRRLDGTIISAKLKEVLVEGLQKIAYSLADEATLCSFAVDPKMRLVFYLAIDDSTAPSGTEVSVVD